MPVCSGCKQLTLHNTKCGGCRRFCCKTCLRFSEDLENSEKLCPECATGNNNRNNEEDVIEVEPKDVLDSVQSSCWQKKFFKATKNGVDKKRVYCRPCLEAGRFEDGLKYSGTTTNLNRHDAKYHSATVAEDGGSTSSTNSGIYGFTNPRSGKKWSKTSVQWKNATNALVKWFVKSSRPANLVTDPGFLEFIAMLVPEYEVPCANTVTNYMEKLFKQKHKELKDELSEIEFFSVISDGGSSTNQMSFQDNQVAYISEDLQLKVKILGVKENRGEHDAEAYRERTEDDLEEFGIPKSKVAQYVTDSEPKMSAAFPHDRSGCLAHIIHKSCEEGLKNSVAAAVMKKFRKIGTKYNTSYKLKYLYLKELEEAGLPVKRLQPDICHRWGSVKVSIESALPSDESSDQNQYFRVLNKTLNSYAAESKKKEQKKEMKELILTTSDMEKLKEIHKLYKDLDVATTVLGLKRRPTGSLALPIIETIKTKVLQADPDDPSFIEDMKIAMKEDFVERVRKNVNVTVMRNASALDPCEKKLKFMKNKDARKIVQNRLLIELKELKASESSELHEIESQREVNEPDEKRRKYGIQYSDSDDDAPAVDNDVVDEEWQIYLSEPECSYDVDPLNWYAERKSKFPTVVRLARLVIMLCLT